MSENAIPMQPYLEFEADIDQKPATKDLPAQFLLRTNVKLLVPITQLPDLLDDPEKQAERLASAMAQLQAQLGIKLEAEVNRRRMNQPEVQLD